MSASPEPAFARPAGAPWSIRDAATYLGVSSQHLHRLIDSGSVQSIRIGRRVLIADSELRKIAELGADHVAR